MVPVLKQQPRCEARVVGIRQVLHGRRRIQCQCQRQDVIRSKQRLQMGMRLTVRVVEVERHMLGPELPHCVRQRGLATARGAGDSTQCRTKLDMSQLLAKDTEAVENRLLAINQATQKGPRLGTRHGPEAMLQNDGIVGPNAEQICSRRTRKHVKNTALQNKEANKRV